VPGVAAVRLARRLIYLRHAARAALLAFVVFGPLANLVLVGLHRALVLS